MKQFCRKQWCHCKAQFSSVHPTVSVQSDQ